VKIRFFSLHEELVLKKPLEDLVDMLDMDSISEERINISSR